MNLIDFTHHSLQISCPAVSTISPFVEQMYEQIKESINEYGVVINRWPQYLMSLESVCTHLHSLNQTSYFSYSGVNLYLFYYKKIYWIRFLGKPTEVGEVQPTNQNHAIIFAGEALQAIDMNQVH